MTSSTYTPREGSVAFRVLEFLCANPDESLSAADVAVKFDCTRNNVHTLLAPAVSAGSLIRRADPEDGELVYRVGSGAPAVSAKPAAAPGSAANPFGAARGPARSPFRIDVTQIAIDADVPLPPPDTPSHRLAQRVRAHGAGRFVCVASRRQVGHRQRRDRSQESHRARVHHAPGRWWHSCLARELTEGR